MISIIDLSQFGYAQCPECERTFDLDKPDESGEWYFGHDCFVEEEEDGKL